MTVPLYATVDGPATAPVLVLGSSLGTTGAMWQPQMTDLTERYRVIRYDHRGHGRSPVVPGPYAIEELGADLLALLDTVDSPQVHLGGLSLGGMVAMWAAAHAPARVSKLVVVCTAAKLGPPELWQQRIDAVREGGPAAIADAVIGRWFTPGFAARHGAVVGWVRQQLMTTPAEGYAGCCAAIQRMDLLGDLGRITAPTLVIAGADDPATPPELAEQIVEAIPDARLAVVPDAAHLANVEQPAEVTRLMTEFLAETP